MTEHQFKIGQVVHFHPKKSRLVSDAPARRLLGPREPSSPGQKKPKVTRDDSREPQSISLPQGPFFAALP